MSAYSVGPAVLGATVQVTPTAQVAGSTITVNGVAVVSGVASALLPLAMGTTPVVVVVTAPDATTTSTYTVVFDRTSAALSDLTAAVGALAPTFDAATLSYSVGSGILTASTTITPTAADPAATVTVNTLATPSGAPSTPVLLPLDLTPVTVQDVQSQPPMSTGFGVLARLRADDARALG